VHPNQAWIIVAAVPSQRPSPATLSRCGVDAVVYYRVVDPAKALVNVQACKFAVAQVAQASLRAVTGRSGMDRLLSEREKVNAELKTAAITPWTSLRASARPPGAWRWCLMGAVGVEVRVRVTAPANSDSGRRW
jgi:regulator of protease activity HflC (stomatin/prohibitin superfamily)